MDEIAATGGTPQIKVISKKDQMITKLEFVNGAISNITPRARLYAIHLESRERPTEQLVESVAEDGFAKLSPFKDTGVFTRDVSLDSH